MSEHQLRFVNDYLPYLLARASLLISSSFHEQVSASGLSVMEWRVMATLSDGPELSIKALCDVVLAKQPTVTKLVGRMEARGWVQRSSSGTDKRQTLVSLTAKGRQAIEPLLLLSKVHEREVLNTFGATGETQLKAHLRELIEQAVQRRN